MRYRNLIGGLFWMVVGVVFCAGGWEYGILRGSIPGAGFFPFMASIVLIALSMGVSITSLWPETTKDICFDGGEKFFACPDSWKRILLALAGLLFFWQGLSYLGFLLTTFIFIIFLLRFIEPQRWVTVLTTAILTTGIAYIVFRILLKVRLPAGILKL
jgi:putative tricarboxylic transport membrane protein